MPEVTWQSSKGKNNIIVPGYYADQLSVAQEVRGNATVSVKDEARGFHLNNLSYAGPIVMGFGGISNSTHNKKNNVTNFWCY